MDLNNHHGHLKTASSDQNHKDILLQIKSSKIPVSPCPVALFFFKNFASLCFLTIIKIFLFLFLASRRLSITGHHGTFSRFSQKLLIKILVISLRVHIMNSNEHQVFDRKHVWAGGALEKLKYHLCSNNVQINIFFKNCFPEDARDPSYNLNISEVIAYL